MQHNKNQNSISKNCSSLHANLNVGYKQKTDKPQFISVSSRKSTFEYSDRTSEFENLKL